MHARPRPRGIARGLMLVVAIAGCAGPDPIPSARILPYGTAIEAGPKPDALRCQERIRAEIGVAVRIRTELMTPGVSTDEGAVRAVAADPASNTLLIGIPLSGPEVRVLKQNGLGLDDRSPISFWVNSGARERFGGIWILGGTTVVAVVDGNPDTLGLARCIEPNPTRYVWAGVSLADGEAVKDRIGTDMDRWRASGVAINTIDYDEMAGVVNVGVSAPSAAALTDLQAVYGPLIRLVRAEPGIPL